MGLFGWGKGRDKDDDKTRPKGAGGDATPSPGDPESRNRRPADSLGAIPQSDMPLSPQAIRERCALATKNDPPATARITTLVFPTRGRVETLRRCIESYVANLRESGRTCELAVLDDSPDAATRQAYRNMLGSLSLPAGIDVRYAGAEEKAAFVEKLSSEAAPAGISPAVVASALLNAHGLSRTTGANHNAGRLHAAGEMALSVDDDTVCRLARPPGGAENGLALSSEYDPTEFWFYPDREQAGKASAFEPVDVLGTHERWLGRSLEECVAASGADQPLEVGGARTDLIRALGTKRKRVALCSSGLVGDSGMGGPAYYLTKRDRTFERLVADSASYRTFRTTRDIFRSVVRATISEGTHLMMPQVGLDGTRLLPPFFPVLRNSDGILGAVLRRTMPDALIAHLPFAVWHDPPESRKFSQADLERGAPLGSVSSTLIALLPVCNLGPEKGEPDVRMRALGRQLEDIASMKGPEFAGLVDLEFRRRRNGFIAHLEYSLDVLVGRPRDWEQDVRLQIERTREAMARPAEAPHDLAEGRTEEDARALMQRLFVDYGRLLHAWPGILAAARALRDRGERLAQPV